MRQRAGIQISRHIFIQALGILFLLMMVAGLLTRVVPAGRYTRVTTDGRDVIDSIPSGSSPASTIPCGTRSWPH